MGVQCERKGERLDGKREKCDIYWATSGDIQLPPHLQESVHRDLITVVEVRHGGSCTQCTPFTAVPLRYIAGLCVQWFVVVCHVNRRVGCLLI